MPLNPKRLKTGVTVGTIAAVALLGGTLYLDSQTEPEIPWLRGIEARRFPRFGIAVYRIPGRATPLRREAEAWAKANGLGVRTLKGSDQLIVYEAGHIVLSANRGTLDFSEDGKQALNTSADPSAPFTTIIRQPRPPLWKRIRHRLLTPGAAP
ncbi:MAG: hypothetical protein ACO1SV_03500 [Fimbriimonas sp.]